MSAGARLTYEQMRLVLWRLGERENGSHAAAVKLYEHLHRLPEYPDVRPPDEHAHAIVCAAIGKAIGILDLIIDDDVLRDRIKELAARKGGAAGKDSARG